MDLTQMQSYFHRASSNFFGRTRENVNGKERWLSAAAGAVILFKALRSKTWLGRAAGLMGAVLLKRGTSGACPLYRRLGVSTS